MSESETNDRGRPRRAGKIAAKAESPQIKDMVLSALEAAGGVDYLVRQAEKDPTRFMMLVAKVLPLQDEGEQEIGKPVARALTWQPPT